MTDVHLFVLPNGTLIEKKEFNFSSKFQGVVLSSFYYGTIWSFVIGGWLATRYGGRVVLTVSALMGSCLTIAVPELSKINEYFIILLRILLGSFMGLIFPAMNAIWSKWAPAYERTSLTSFAMSGCYFGNVCTLASGGYISRYLGWPAVFYITGSFSFIWAIVCGKVVKNDPSHDKYISNEELMYIKNSIEPFNSQLMIPWKKILTSGPVWSIVIAHFCANWGLFTLLTELPTFLREVWQYDLGSVGYLSALPYIANGVTLLISGRLADKLLKSGLFSITCVRKVYLCTAFAFEMVLIDAAGLAHNQIVVIVCFIGVMATDAFSWCTFGVNFLDIATQYASIIMGISCTFAFIPGILSPLLVGIIVTDKKDHEQWKYVFINCGFLYFFGAIFYGIFGTGELQYWAKNGDNLTTERIQTNSEHNA